MLFRKVVVGAVFAGAGALLASAIGPLLAAGGVVVHVAAAYAVGQDSGMRDPNLPVVAAGALVGIAGSALPATRVLVTVGTS